MPRISPGCWKLWIPCRSRSSVACTGPPSAVVPDWSPCVTSRLPPMMRRLASPRPNWGLFPRSSRLTSLQKIGPSAARELFLTASRFNAKRARRIGLIHKIVPESDLDSAVDECVQEVLSSAPGAIAAAKALIKDVANRPSADVIGLTTTRIAEQRVSAEGQEGMRAFLQKRKPNWIP